MEARRTQGVRMADIARVAGVSRAAVSYVLNNRADASVSDVTRKRIFDAAAELRYRPHAGARALAAQRSGLFGLVTEIVTAPFGPETIKGAQDQAWLEGKFLLIAATEGRLELEGPAFERLLQQRVEGLILATGSHKEVSLPPSAYDVPLVLVHCFDAERRLASVLPDEIGGGYRATRRLLDAGHERIGMVNLERSEAATGRYAGYVRALTEAGIVADPDLVVSGIATADGGYEATKVLLALPHRPTAIFCGTDRMAMGAYDAVKEAGLAIRKDVAIVGFDDQQIISAYLRPKLTTVALPFEAMGATAVTLLGKLVAGEEIAPRTTVDCTMVERASV
jgi:LacI family transcriptional regulator